jgi:hypothetical protein
VKNPNPKIKDRARTAYNYRCCAIRYKFEGNDKAAFTKVRKSCGLISVLFSPCKYKIRTVEVFKRFRKDSQQIHIE